MTVFVPPIDPPPKGMERHLTLNPAVSSKIFLSNTARLNALKLIWGFLKYFEMLISARHDDCLLVMGAIRAFPVLTMDTKSCSGTPRPIGIELSMKHQGSEAL